MRARFWLALFITSILLTLSGCASEPSPNWDAVQNFTYQLQRARPDRIGETGFDLVVVSIGTAGNSPETIPALKNSPGGEKIVLCYMSIGQAEDYRWYWQPEWNENLPEFLGEPDPVWGERWTEYWNPEWQSIIYGSPDSYLDRIIE